MKKLEIILASTILILMTLSFFLIPGIGTLMVILTSSLSLIYFYLGFVIFNKIPFRKAFQKSTYTSISVKEIIIGALAGIVMSNLLLGILFKLQFWPGSNNLLTIGLVGSGIIALLTIIFLRSSKSPIKNTLIRRLGIAVVLSLIMLSIPANTLIDLKYRKNPEVGNALKELPEGPDSPEARRIIDEQLNN